MTLLQRIVTSGGRLGWGVLILCVSGLTVPEPLRAFNIAWITSHPSEEEPLPDLVAAGFTEAPDAGYTRLLREEGHFVTRLAMTRMPDELFLRRFDLVILSPTAGDGFLLESSEAEAWNRLSVPMVVVNSGLMSYFQLGFIEPITIPATGSSVVVSIRIENAISLATDFPDHELFSGVALSGEALTTGPCIEVVQVSGQDAEGVSLLINRTTEEAVILATVGDESEGSYGRTVIAEWRAGAQMADGCGVLGGARLSFLSGSGPVGGYGSDTRGVFDLTPIGARIFLNAVAYLAQPQVLLEVSVQEGTHLRLNWSGGGMLEWAPVIEGPWTSTGQDSGSAMEPLLDSGRRFYRVRRDGP